MGTLCSQIYDHAIDLKILTPTSVLFNRYFVYTDGYFYYVMLNFLSNKSYFMTTVMNWQNNTHQTPQKTSKFDVNFGLLYKILIELFVHPILKK